MNTLLNWLLVPYQIVNWDEDLGFINSDPFDGKRWNMSREWAGSTDWTPWDDIHPGELRKPEREESLRVEICHAHISNGFTAHHSLL